MTAAMGFQNASALPWGLPDGVRTLLALMDEPARAAAEQKVLSRPSETDLADIRASLRGDGEAFARIIRRYQDTLARRMARIARDAAGVEELVHDVFVEAYFSL